MGAVLESLSVAAARAEEPALATRANARHRAEVMKVMVLCSARRQGIGRALMHAAEEHQPTYGGRP